MAQAVLTHAMSVFKIPITVCEDIKRAIAQFWWGSKKEQNGIHWANWRSLCQAKIRGLGFRDFACFNQALLAKQSWRIIQHPQSILSRVLKEWYFKNTDFLQAKLGSNPSFIWRSILWGRKVTHQGMRWRIGTGDKIKVYKSNWMPRPQTFKPISRPTLDPECKVAELIDENQQWKEALIHAPTLQA